MKRRGFAAVLCLLLLAGCAGPEARQRQIFAMDTVMTLTAYGPNGEAALDAAAAELQRLDALLSTGNPDSQVSQLNRAGGGPAGEDVQRLLAAALTACRDTGGLFDCTIYPLMTLWGFSTGDYRVPGEEEIAALLPLVDASRLRFGGSSVQLGPGQQIDFGGIAKGYASQRLMDIFRDRGVASAIVSLGGNVQCLGTKPDGSPWRVGVQDPAAPRGAYLAVLAVEDRAVVTSGGYERFFEEDGRTYCHILDPRTGRPAETDLLSATVLSRDAALADAMSTALYIMGLEDAAEFWRESGADFDMVLLTRGGELYATGGVTGLETDLPVTALAREP